MDRGKEIELAANSIIDDLNGLEGFDRTDMINMFGSAVTWAEEHPKDIEGCDFCKQLGGINHKSDECYLSYDGETLCVDIECRYHGAVQLDIMALILTIVRFVAEN